MHHKITALFALYITLIHKISSTNSPWKFSVDIGDAFDEIIANKNSSIVTGQVTVLPEGLVDKKLTDTGNGFASQDSTGGIWVYIKEETFYDSDITKKKQLTYGRWVNVTGHINTANGADEKALGGLIRITPKSMNDIQIGDMGEPVTPQIITPDQVADYQGELIKMEDVTVTLVVKNNSWGTDFMIENADRSESTSLFFYPNARSEMVQFNKTYDFIIGFASIYININGSHILEEEWEVWPRSKCDFDAQAVCDIDEGDGVEQLYAVFVNIVVLIFCIIQ